MMKRMFVVMMYAGIFCLTKSGTTLSIYEIQYTTNADGTSNLDTQKVNCTGGIVIYKWDRGRQRVVLYDPNNPNGWGGICVKGDPGTNPTPFNSVELGDWIYLDNVLVNETGKSRGNTDLIFDNVSSYSILSKGNPLPKPLVVDVNEIAVIYDPVYQTCFVTDHRAEKYEGMYIQVRNVSVGDVNVGKAPPDNYSLASDQDPNIYCWASDYMNADKPSGLMHLAIITPGQHFCSVSGIFEQYTDIPYGWDYYQILTTKLDDLQITQKGDSDGDCDVDFEDLAILADNWLVGTR